MKLTIIGGGSTYTPELISGIIENNDKLNVTAVFLMDTDKERLDILSSFTKRMLNEKKSPIEVFATTDLEEALLGAHFVLTQIRVGGQQARLIDEEISLEFDCIGQETTGPGGFSKALRTIPEILKIAKKMEKLCPKSFLVNFTNPSGIITQAVNHHSKINCLGLCNVPIVMKNRISETIGKPLEEIEVDYFGLNHLSFIRDIIVEGKSIFDDCYYLCADKDFEKDLLTDLELIPSPYLRYYFYRDQILNEQKNGNKLRAKEVMEVENNLLEDYKNKELKDKPALLSKRGGALYSKAACDLISSLKNDAGIMQIINVVQKGVFKDLPYNAVCEMPAMVSSIGAEPVKLRPIPLKVRGLIQDVYSYEELTVQAALKGSVQTAVAALMTHPLVGDYKKAKGIVDKILKEHKQYLPNFV
ncbi:MAG: 6-phospho-beta-glucosidase [Armatimonadota bacterium]